MTNRRTPKARQAELLEAAIKVARDEGFENLTKEKVADEIGVTHGLVTHYFGTMGRLRTRVMRAAIKQEILEIVAYGLYAKHPQALKAPQALRDKALEHMGAPRG